MSYNTEFYFSKNPSPQNDPSYLFKHFTNVTENKFPSEIDISFSFSSFDGILLTTFDQNGNILLIKIDNGNECKICYGLEHKKILLNLACNCQRFCLNEILNLTVWIDKNRATIRCNNGVYYEFSIKDSLKVKPYISFPKPTISNQAYLWIMNHKSYPYHPPYPYQMIGCIFDIKYRGTTINPEIIGSYIDNFCPRNCDNIDKCNGGKCFETYSKYDFICDCTGTIYNGPRCNQKISEEKSPNIQYNLKYPLIKISWRTNNEIIVKITKYLQFSLKVLNHKNTLNIEINHINKNITEKDKLVDNYDIESIYTMIFNFSNREIRIEMPSMNITKYFTLIPIYNKNNLTVEVYGALALEYKLNSRHIIWDNEADYITLNQNSLSDISKCNPVTLMTKSTPHSFQFISYIFNGISLLIIILLIMYIKCIRRSNDNTMHNEINEPSNNDNMNDESHSNLPLDDSENIRMNS